MEMKKTYKVYKYDRRFGFESKTMIGHISVKDDENFETNLDKEIQDLYRYYADSCHTVFDLIPEN